MNIIGVILTNIIAMITKIDFQIFIRKSVKNFKVHQKLKI